MSDQCFICCNDSPKNVVTCNMCSNKKDGIQMITCLSCVKKYLLEEHTDANCMICKNIWSMSFLYSIFPKSFINNEYRKHLAKIYLEREKSLIPSTIPLANIVKERKLRLEQIRNDIEEKTTQVEHLMTKLRNAEIELSQSKQRLSKILAEPYLPTDFEKIIKSAPVYLLPCPFPDCRGLIEKKSKTCPICNTKICNSCLEIVTGKHICEPQKLSTASEIKKNTKPCPKCATRIYKYEGCDLMWCTQCQTPFSWEKGTIANTKNIHNPHYFDWLHQMAVNQKNESGALGVIGVSNNRQSQNNQCDQGQLPDYSTLLTPLNKKFHYNDPKLDQIRAEHRDLTALIYDELPRLRTDKKRHEKDATLRNRIQFILGESSEDSLKRMVITSERKKHKYTIIVQILEAYVSMCVERLNLIYHQLDKLSLDEISVLLKEIQTIRDLANSSLKREIFELMGYECYPMLLKGLTYVRESKDHE